MVDGVDLLIEIYSHSVYLDSAFLWFFSLLLFRRIYKLPSISPPRGLSPTQVIRNSWKPIVIPVGDSMSHDAVSGQLPSSFVLVQSGNNSTDRRKRGSRRLAGLVPSPIREITSRSMISHGRLAKIYVYPSCTSLGRMCCFYSFSRLMKSISYALSVRLRIPTPPASTIRLRAKTALRRTSSPIQIAM